MALETGDFPPLCWFWLFGQSPSFQAGSISASPQHHSSFATRILTPAREGGAAGMPVCFRYRAIWGILVSNLVYWIQGEAVIFSEGAGNKMRDPAYCLCEDAVPHGFRVRFTQRTVIYETQSIVLYYVPREHLFE